MFTGGPYTFKYRDSIGLDNEVELSFTKSQARSVVETLESTNWLNKGSGAAMLEVVTYTYGLDLLTLIVVVVELPTMGGLAVTSFVHTLRLHEYRQNHYWVLVLVLFALSIVVFSLYVVYKAWKYGFTSYFHSFWNVLDVFVVFFAWWMVSLDVAFNMILEDTVDTYNRYRKVRRFQYLMSVHFWRSCAVGMTAFCLILRCFQFLELFFLFNRLLIVLAHVFGYLVSLLLYLLLLFFAVASFMHVIAGRFMNEFRSLDVSLLNVIFDLNSVISDVLSHSDKMYNMHTEWCVILFAFLLLTIKLIALCLSFAIVYAAYRRFNPKHPSVEQIPFLLQQYFNDIFNKKEKKKRK